MSVMHAGARAPMAKGLSILLLLEKFQESFHVQVHMPIVLEDLYRPNRFLPMKIDLNMFKLVSYHIIRI